MRHISTSNTPTLTSIEVTPSLATAAAGTTTQFTATGLYTDNSKQDLTTQVTWASSNIAVATVSNAAGSKGLATDGRRRQHRPCLRPAAP